jgi:hypothetical protein
MDANELLRIAFADLHKELLDDIDGLPDEDLFWQPGAAVNHIGFLVWHIVRDEDTVVCQAILNRPQLWARERWHARLGMDASQQGTGFDSGQVGSVRYDLPVFLHYANAVFAQTDAALAAMAPARLLADLDWSSDWRLANLLTTGCLSHGWVHLGEIRQLRGLRGWKFRE